MSTPLTLSFCPRPRARSAGWKAAWGRPAFSRFPGSRRPSWHSTRLPVGATPGDHPVHLDRVGEADDHRCAGPSASTRVLLNVIVGWSSPPSRSASMSRLMSRSLVTSMLATGIDALTDDASGRPHRTRAIPRARESPCGTSRSPCSRARARRSRAPDRWSMSRAWSPWRPPRSASTRPAAPR